MVIVLERVHARHPELSAEDVRKAWEGAVAHAPRTDSRPFECMAVGFDSRGRAIEMLGRMKPNGDWVVWHAFTPPTRKALRELGLGGGRNGR